MTRTTKRSAGLFITRSIDALTRESEEAEGPKLRRALGPWALIAIGLGNMVGAGIFATIGDGVHNKAGPAVMVSFLIAAVACAFAALCYAEFSSMVPVAGSAYTYTYATLGEIVAWMIGWNLVLEYGIAAAPVASTLSANIQDFLTSIGHQLPHWATSAYSPSNGTVFDVLAAFAVLVFSGLFALGIREAAGTNSILVIFKMAILTTFVVLGFSHINSVNWQPFSPFGFHGVITGAFTVFFAFIGFDAVTTAAEEAKNPQRDVPWGVLGALGLGALFYIAIAFVLTGMQPAVLISERTPLSTALEAVHLNKWAWLMNVGAIFGTVSVILTSLLGQSRIFFVMARDGLLPKGVATIHPRFRTPARMTMITGSVVALMAGLVPLDTLLSFVNIGTLSAFIFVCAGVMLLRKTQPDRPRGFRAPLVPLVPILGIALSLFLAGYGSNYLTWYRFVIWLAVGAVIYLIYGYRHSEERKAAIASTAGSTAGE